MTEARKPNKTGDAKPVVLYSNLKASRVSIWMNFPII